MNPRAKHLLIPLSIAGLAAAVLATPAQAAAEPERTPLSAGRPGAYAVADFWLGANGAALKQARQYTWDSKDVAKLVRGQGDTTDGKPGQVAPIGGAKGTSVKVRNVNLPKTAGKVFFLDHKGVPRWCSGTSIQSRYRNLVATAGHCVYDVEGNEDVLRRWVFIPGYHDGKAPWGVYVGQTAFAHYNFAVHEDFDHDYAFVAVYDGIQLGGGKVVSKTDWDRHTGAKGVEKIVKKVTREQYEDWVGRTAQVGIIEDAVAPQTVGPEAKGAVYQPKEVTRDEYADAAGVGGPTAVKIGAQAFSETVSITKEAHDAYVAKQKGTYWPAGESFKGHAAPSADGKGWTLTRYYTKAWTIPGSEAEYYTVDYVYVIGLIKNVGRLGDVVGGQGFAWNQKPGQPVFAFGYPGDAHPDGDKPYTGLTMKYCHGKTNTGTYASNAFKVEDHLALKCSMTGGSDGGPWLLKYSNSKRLGYVNGVTSLFHDQDGNDRIDFVSSPYFNGDTAEVYADANQARNAKIVSDQGELLN
ncbi:trypsin-like serine peptidase [Planobispora rosea]|uniref:trypsin-like serine peptidase n=1 Tax=Planobispora rosea TaxID=35762 RepID=UPI000839FB21|nr:hypothetical protein [Planobispora rosea]